MKASSATSARATASPLSTGPSSASRPPSPTRAKGFALTGPTQLPNPEYNAFRRDLADVAIAGEVIASHYAEPVERIVAVAAPLRSGPSDEAEAIRTLQTGERFLMLDDTAGLAWGYAGDDRRVGYVRAEALRAS